MSRQTIAHIDLSALKHNLARVREMAPHSAVMAVIKADAYGHGLERVVGAIEPDQFCVATLGEAERVRDAGWRGALLLLEGFANREEMDLARRLECELVVHNPAQLNRLQDDRPWSRRLWLKLDSGMHRLGFPAAQAAALHERLAALTTEDVGLMTHFACADDADNPFTAEQIRVFDEATRGLPGPRSLANSAAILNYPDAHRDWVRSGIMLYGISPLAGRDGNRLGLRPVMRLSCRLVAVNACRAGDVVGYQAAYRCPEDMPVGIAAIGYGDGYSRHLGNGTPVLVAGRPAQLIGRVSMDLISIDLREVADARVGDEVVLWGDGLAVETVAAHAETIAYELVCGVTSRVKMTFSD